jgi:choline transport protein
MTSEKKSLEDVHPDLNSPQEEVIVAVEDGVALNASGWKDQLRRQYGLLGLCGIALTVDNAWVALGSSISVSIRRYP